MPSAFSKEPTTIKELVLTPLTPGGRGDGRHEVRLPLHVIGQIALGRNSHKHPNPWGVLDPRVSREQVRLRSSPPEAPTVTVMGAKPVLVISAKTLKDGQPNGQQMTLKKGQSAPLNDGDQVHLVAEETFTPGPRSSTWGGNPCAYRIDIVSITVEQSRAKAAEADQRTQAEASTASGSALRGVVHAQVDLEQGGGGAAGGHGAAAGSSGGGGGATGSGAGGGGGGGDGEQTTRVAATGVPLPAEMHPPPTYRPAAAASAAAAATAPKEAAAPKEAELALRLAKEMHDGAAAGFSGSSTPEALSAVLTAMRGHTTQLGVQDYGCRALAKLAMSEEGSRAVLAVEGSVAAVAEAMGGHTTNLRVQAHGCLTLANLTMSEEGRRAGLSAGSSVAAVLTAIRGHTTNLCVQANGCRALANLAMSEEGRRAVLAVEGSVAAVLEAMRGHTTHSGVQDHGCRVLANLAICGEGKQAVLAVEGSIAAAVEAVRGHATKSCVQTHGCRALANLAIGEEGTKAVLAVEGSVAAVLEALKGHTIHVGVQANGCRALANLTLGADGKLAVLAVEGSVAAVLEALKGHTIHVGVQANGGHALANLAEREEGRQAVIAVNGAVAAIVMMTTSSNETVKRQGCRAMSNLKLSEDGRRAVLAADSAAPAVAKDAATSSSGPSSSLRSGKPEAREQDPSNTSKRPRLPSNDDISGAKKQRVSLENLEAELAAEKARREEAESRVAAASKQEKDLLMIRYMALRQHFECLRMAARAGTTTWPLKLARGSLVSGVLEHFLKLSMGANLSGPVQLWRNTRVAFEGEAGVDEGGPTAEMHALFWVEVCKPAHGLFEQHPDEGDGRYLPKRGAPPELLESVGRVLLKSIVDDHPTGPQLARFLFLFLRGRCCFEPQGATDAHAREALDTLADFAPGLARRWRVHALEASADQLGDLTLDMFDEALGEGAVTRANVASAVVAGCRRVLLQERSDELKALERGFTFSGKVDLALQLAPIPAEQLLLMVRGKDELSAEDLLGCFKWPAADEATSGAAAHLRTVIAGRLDQKSRRLLLRWCTARSTLPVDGLKEKVTIELLLPEAPLGPDGYFPRSHTCYPSIELPAYSSADVLLQQLQLALVDLERGGGFGLE